MLKLNDKYKKTPFSVLTISFLGVIHFMISIIYGGYILWLYMFNYESASKNSNYHGIRFFSMIPALVIFIFFIVAFKMALKKKKLSSIIMALCLIASMGLFVIETKCGLYQLRTPIMHINDKYYNITIGEKHLYTNWWWYSEKELYFTENASVKKPPAANG